MDETTFGAAIAALEPHLSDRGRLEVDAALLRMQVAGLQQAIAERDQTIAALTTEGEP